MRNNVYKMLFMIVLSSLLLFLSMPGNRLSLVVFIAFIPFFYSIKDSSSVGEAMFAGLLFGGLSGTLIYSGFFLYGSIIFFYSVILLAIEFGLFGLLSKRFSFYVLMFAVPVLEYIRTLGPFGFPSSIAIALWQDPELIGLSRYFGIYVISMCIISVNLLLYLTISERQKKYLFPVFMIFVVMIIPYRFSNQNKISNKDDSLKVSIIQGGIPIWMYSMEPFSRKYNNLIEKTYITLTEKALSQGCDLIVWPETALHRFILNKKSTFYREFFEMKSRESDSSFVVGTPYRDKNGERNSLFLVKGNEHIRYDKMITVPIVESYFKKGEKYTFLENSQISLTPAICFESTFDSLVSKNTASGGDFIVVSTNDAGFRNTLIPYLHASYSVFRAVENRRYLIRAAQAGISMIIDENGNITKQMDLFTTGYLSGEIRKIKGLSFFTKYRDIIICIYVFLFIFSIIKSGASSPESSDH